MTFQLEPKLWHDDYYESHFVLLHVAFRSDMQNFASMDFEYIIYDEYVLMALSFIK